MSRSFFPEILPTAWPGESPVYQAWKVRLDDHSVGTLLVTVPDPNEADRFDAMLLKGDLNLTAILQSGDPTGYCAELFSGGAGEVVTYETARLLTRRKRLRAPIDARQALLAGGVTWKPSLEARKDEARPFAACYDNVYPADKRMEIFHGASGWEVRGSGQRMNIPWDGAKRTLPEPELGIVFGWKEVDSKQKLCVVGYTICNDLTACVIEADTGPLGLWQAKCWDCSKAVGPCLTITDREIPRTTKIRMTIASARAAGEGEQLFDGSAELSGLNRTPENMLGWLARNRRRMLKRGGVFSTGTCIVPPDTAVLRDGYRSDMTIDGLGCLTNTYDLIREG